MFIKRFKNLYKFKQYYDKYKKNIVSLLIVMLVASVTGVFISYLMSEQLIGITNQNAEMAIRFTIFILASVTLHHINWYLWSRFHFKLARLISKDIKNDIVSNLLDTKYITIKNNTSGYYLERLNGDVDEISTFLGNVLGVFVDLFTNVSFLVIVYFLSWQLGLLFTAGITLLFLIESFKVKLDLKNLEQVKNSTETSNSAFNEIIYGIKDIKGFGIKQEISNKMENLNTDLLNKTYKKNNQFEILSRIGTYLQWIIDSALVFITMLWLLPTGQISIVILLLVFNYKSLMYDTVGFFSKVKSYYVNGDFYAKRILEITNNTYKENFGKTKINLVAGKITIKDLSFSYDDKKILDNVNLEIRPNTLNVLVGISGGGKSTLFMILSKLYFVENNKIYFDDIDINNIDEECLRNNLCIVNQETFIFQDTIMHNIKIVKPNATNEEVFNACKKANIYDEIVSMPSGFDTILTENGSNLSGGQKQRIAMARCYLKDSKIILLDEPTSALDNENQEKLFNALKELSKTKTIFVIAHKLSNYDYFDNVYKLQNLNIVKKDVNSY